MKRIILLFVSLFVVSSLVWADNDKPIQVSEMPADAQQFIKTHFAGQAVAVAKVEKDFFSKSYDVIFTNGNKVEFDKSGKWTNVDCKYSQVPVAIIPAQIKNYVSKYYKNAKVVQIELNDRKGYEIELNNGLEIEFDKNFKVIDIDK
jgi:hypothetical protein